MSHQFRNNAPLPYLTEKRREEDELRTLGIDKDRRKFNARDLLMRISGHNPGDKVSLRTEDHPLIDSLKETGLISIRVNESNPVVERTALKIPEAEFHALTYTLEEKIANLRKRLEKIAPETQSS